MRVLLTGGTGFLGGHLLEALRARDHQVLALSRSAEGDARLRALGADPVRGDLSDSESLARAFAAAPEAVVHAAADTSTDRAHAERQQRINVEGTAALARIARERRVARFLHTSSVSSFSHLVHGTLREDTPRRGGESWIAYERTKFLGEEAVRAQMREGLPATIFWPAHVFGPGDTHNWARLIQLVDRDALPGAPPGSGAFADVREIARTQVAALEADVAGEGFLLGGEHARFVELIALIAGRLGRRAPKRATPAFALRAYAAIAEAIARWRGREPELTREAATFTCHHLTVDSSKAQRVLGYRVTPLAALIDDTLAWMRGAGMLRA